MNDGDLKALKEEVKAREMKLKEVSPPAMDLDKLAAAGDRVKREKAAKALEKKGEDMTDQQVKDLESLKKKMAKDKLAVDAEKALEAASVAQ